MTSNEVFAILNHLHGQAIQLDGLDDAIIGIATDIYQGAHIVYDHAKILEVYERTMSTEEAGKAYQERVIAQMITIEETERPIVVYM